MYQAMFKLLCPHIPSHTSAEGATIRDCRIQRASTLDSFKSVIV